MKTKLFVLLLVLALSACAVSPAPAGIQISPTGSITVVPIVAPTLAPVVTASTQAKLLTLRMAVADDQGRPSEPYVLEFIEQVKTRSNGSITIEPVWNAGDDTTPPFEQGVVQVVKEGKYDLGLAASRAWDSSGVTSFEALQAPFLITNDDLAKAVATSDTAKQMLESLSSTGVTGLTLWPEDLRHPFSIVPGKSILAPADFAGLTVRAIASEVTYLLIEKMNGKPVNDPDEYQAAESGLRQGVSLQGKPSATGNVTFFPKFQVLFANAAAFKELSDAQQTILRAAAAATQKKAIAEHPSDVENGKAWCADGGTIVMTSPEQVAAFEKAAQPVFEFIEKDPVNKAHIAAIRDLKAKTPPSAGPAACAPAAAAQPTPQPTARSEVWSPGLPPNGVWRVELTVDDLVGIGMLKSEAESNRAGEYTVTYRDGKAEYHYKHYKGDWESSCMADLTVVDNLFRVTYTSGDDCKDEVDDVQWRLGADGLHLHLDAIKNSQYLPNKAWYEAKPWQKITKP